MDEATNEERLPDVNVRPNAGIDRSPLDEIKAILSVRSRRPDQAENLHLRFRPPEEWKDDFSITVVERYDLLFAREPRPKAREDVAGVGLRVVDRAVRDATELTGAFGAIWGLDAPLFVLRVRDRIMCRRTFNAFQASMGWAAMRSPSAGSFVRRAGTISPWSSSRSRNSISASASGNTTRRASPALVIERPCPGDRSGPTFDDLGPQGRNELIPQLARLEDDVAR